MAKFKTLSELSILYNLKMAGLVCAIQSGFYSIYLSTYVYQMIYMNFLIHKPPIFAMIFNIQVNVKDTLYLVIIIIDSIVPIFLLKSYRRVVVKIWSKIIKKKNISVASQQPFVVIKSENEGTHQRLFTKNVSI